MRVLHLLNHTKRLNGNVHAAVDLACAQSKLGHSVAVASAGGHFDELFSANRVETIYVSQERRITTLAKAVWTLRRLVKDWRPDVVHAHMTTSAVIAWPVCKMLRVPLVATVHNEFERGSILMGLGTRVIAVSAAVSQSLIERGIDSAKLNVVLNGTIGSARLQGVDRTPRRLSSPSIVFVGGQHPRKGLPDLFSAFEAVYKTYPSARLHIVGEGPCLESYKELVGSMQCRSAVTFVGAQEPLPYMFGADIFVLPSHADPAPLVLSEAREAGCAIVATQVDGIPELLENGKAGILVPARNPARLAEAIGSLVEDPIALQEWRKKSQFNIDHLKIERVARQTIEVYASAAWQINRRVA
jgi:glycosyltransferase involved in cell wall biosynthesis